MKNFLQKKIKDTFTLNLCIVVAVLTIASLIPIIQTYGLLNISHDTLIPPIPAFSYKTAYQWNDANNGVYISNNYFIWISIFNLFTSLGLSIYQTGFIYQFLIFFFSSLGIYKIYNLFNKGNKLFGLLPAVFIILSPHYLDHLIYYLGTVGIIWVSYFLFKFIAYKKLALIDVISLCLSFGIISDLPNPKYHFLLLLLIFFALTISLLVRLISLKTIVRHLLHFSMIFLGTLYLTLPFIFYAYSFLQSSGVKIFVKQGYKETGVTLDYGYALISKMIRLFHTPSLNASDGEVITNPFFSLAFYAVPIIVLGVFPLIFRFLDRSTKKIYTVFYILALLFLFISKSSNPPFGFIYEYLLSNFKVLAFMRTTAGVVIFAAIFFALIYGRIFQYVSETNFKKMKTFLLLLLVLLTIIVGYPIWSGHYFLNKSTVNSYVDRKEYGLKIPKDYFKSAAFIKNIELDTKIDIYPYSLGYQNNKWGYYGFMFFPWLLDKPIISFDKRPKEGQIASKTNALYMYHDKTLEDNYDPKLFFHKPESLIFFTPMIDIYQKKGVDFLPHFYTRKIEPANRVVLEFKNINPTKYRVVVHNASKPFSLIFTENFHPLWKVYLKKYQPNQDSKTMINQLNSRYVEPMTSEKYRADKKDIHEYITKGLLTTLGNTKIKKRTYYNYVDEKIVPEKYQDYFIDFISQDIKGTIQNNNLQTGSFFETFSLQELEQTNKMVNGYANSWYLEPKNFCGEATAGNCIKNNDGSYNFEMVVEFWPQNLANMSYAISVITLVVLIFLYGVRRFLVT